MAEKSVWTHLRDKFDFGIIERHEDGLVLGLADTSYNFIHKLEKPVSKVYGGERVEHILFERYAGWIELKQGILPLRDSSKVTIKFEPEQKPWLQYRGLHGAACWVLVRVGREYMLFFWTEIDILGNVNMWTLRERATAQWTGGINRDELKEVLMKFG